MFLHFEVDRGWGAIASCSSDGSHDTSRWPKTTDVHAVNCERCLRTNYYREEVVRRLEAKRRDIDATRMRLAEQDNDERLLIITLREMGRAGGWPDWATIAGARTIHDTVAECIANGDLDVYAMD